MSQVTLADISKTYAAGPEAVSQVDITVEDGEFLVIVGPSGSGKTTLMRMIAGLEDPTDGTISIGDRVVNNVRPRDRNIAMVFQDYALYANMTVAQNLAFGLRVRKEPKAEIEARVKEVATLLGIDQLLPRRPRELSGGERQRVALGRAIIRRPELFLMDEPLSNLDALLRVQMRAELSKLHELLGTTIVYVTHDQVEAMTMGSRIAVMRGGKLQQVAPPREIYNAPANRFVASFFGSPPMNFLEGELRPSGAVMEFSEAQLGLELRLGADLEWVDGQRRAEGPVILGVRPEHLGLSPAGSGDVDGEVEVVEPLGSETILYVGVRGRSLALKTSATDVPERHETVSVTVAADRVHLFDSEDDRSLLHRGVVASRSG